MPAGQICRGCGQFIFGNAIMALGAAWHPEHFVCAGCGRPIGTTSFVPHEGRPYHPTCFAHFFAPHCAYCGKPLIGEYAIDYWGTMFCKKHEREYPRCSYCGRLVPPQQQGPVHEPGITRCPVCRATAVETIEGARPRYDEVKRWIGSQGLIYNNLPLSLELCSRDRLAALLQDRHLTHAYGATLSASYSVNGQKMYAEVRGVAVLRGLPAALFQGVTAHELGHVWLIVHDINNLPDWAIEGFCELLAYRWHSSAHSEEHRYHAFGIERRADPIYGAGFRHLRAIVDRIGFPQLIQTLQESKQLPR